MSIDWETLLGAEGDDLEDYYDNAVYEEMMQDEGYYVDDYDDADYYYDYHDERR